MKGLSKSNQFKSFLNAPGNHLRIQWFIPLGHNISKRFANKHYDKGKLNRIITMHIVFSSNQSSSKQIHNVG